MVNFGPLPALCYLGWEFRLVGFGAFPAEGFCDWNGEELNVLNISGTQNGTCTLSPSNFPTGLHVTAMRVTTYLQSTGLRDWTGCTAKSVYTGAPDDP